MVTNRVDARRLGRHMARAAAADVRRAMEVREKLGSANFFDVGYRDLLRDTMGTVRSIYRRFGDELQPVAEAAMVAHLAANPQNKHGVHSYSLEQFGLDAAAERERFAAYTEAFASYVHPGRG